MLADMKYKIYNLEDTILHYQKQASKNESDAIWLDENINELEIPLALKKIARCKERARYYKWLAEQLIELKKRRENDELQRV